GCLGPRVRNARNQRALACVRKSDQADIGQELQAKAESALLARPAGFGAARRAIGGCRKTGVTPSAVAAARDEHAITHLRQIRQRNQLIPVLLVDDGARRHLELHIGTAVARAVGSLAVLAAFGRELWMEP